MAQVPALLVSAVAKETDWPAVSMLMAWFAEVLNREE